MATIGMLALSFAAALTVHAIGYAILLAPPGGIDSPQHLFRVMIQEQAPTTRMIKVAPVITYPEYRAFDRSGAGLFAAYTVQPVQVPIGGDWRRLRVAFVSEGFFRVIGKSALAHPAEFRDLESGIVVADNMDRVISHTRQGRVLRINGTDVPVVAVASTEFAGLDLEAVDAWLPARLARDIGLVGSLSVDARMWTLVVRSASAEPRSVLEVKLGATLHAIDERFGASARRMLWLASLNEDRFAESSRARRVLIYGLYFLLGGIVAVAWVSALVVLMMRVAATRVEFATRIALGAAPRTIIGGIIGEAALVQCVALLAGVVLAALTLHTTRELYPEIRWRFHAGGTAAFGAAIFVAATCVSAIPAVAMAFRSNVASVLGGKGGVSPMSRRARLGSFSLLAGQAAISVSLIAISGAVLKRVAQAAETPFGFATAGTYAIRADIPRRAPIKTSAEAAALQRSVMRWEPVQFAVWAQNAPLISAAEQTSLAPGKEGGEVSTFVNRVQPGYFRALSIRLLQGRDFMESDLLGKANPVVVDTPAVRLLGLPRSPIGRCIPVLPTSEDCSVIVGVVDGVRAVGVWSKPPATIYYPSSETAPDVASASLLIVRVNEKAADVEGHLLSAIRQAGLDPSRFLIESLARKRSAQTSRWRSALLVSAAAAVVTLILGAWGQAILVAFDMRCRRREIGLRAALGASAGRLVVTTTRIPVLCSIAGVMAGAISGFGLSRYLVSWMGQPASEQGWHTLLGVVTALAVVLLSAGIPAFKAARMSPRAALDG